MKILDANGKPYMIKPVGITSYTGNGTTTPFLVEGSFEYKRILV